VSTHSQTLEESELAQQLRVERKKTDAVRQLGQVLGGTLELDPLLVALLGKVTEILDAERATLYLVSEDGSYLESKVVEGGHIATIRLKPGEGLAGWVAKSKETANLADAYADPRFNPAIDKESGFRTRSILAMPMPDHRGKTIGVLQVLNKRDGQFTADDEALLATVAAHAGIAIENRKLSEAQSRQERLAAIGQMVSGLIHDLKTPMTIISCYSQLMADMEEKDQRKHYNDLILRQFDLLSAMTGELLQFARGESELLVRQVFLDKWLEEMKGQIGPELANANVELVVEAGYNGHAHFDENKLLRVVHNLGRNAAEAMSAQGGGKFTISVTRSETELLITFTDTGPGIPPVMEGRLFEAFATSGKKDGTGLGLAIVKKIVGEHDGTVSCVSQPGRGTTFRVALPLLRRE
jgi:K+-sensing histidine kinase KdpD